MARQDWAVHEPVGYGGATWVHRKQKRVLLHQLFRQCYIANVVGIWIEARQKSARTVLNEAQRSYKHNYTDKDRPYLSALPMLEDTRVTTASKTSSVRDYWIKTADGPMENRPEPPCSNEVQLSSKAEAAVVCGTDSGVDCCDNAAECRRRNQSLNGNPPESTGMKKTKAGAANILTSLCLESVGQSLSSDTR